MVIIFFLLFLGYLGAMTGRRSFSMAACLVAIGLATALFFVHSTDVLDVRF